MLGSKKCLPKKRKEMVNKKFGQQNKGKQIWFKKIWSVHIFSGHYVTFILAPVDGLVLKHSALAPN